jgi:hypothetical protein
MASLTSSMISYISTKGPKEIALFILGFIFSSVLFFGSGIFVAHLFLSGIAGVFLGILLAFGAIFAVAFLFVLFQLSKIRKMTM